jgi:hypothetical protein
MPRTPSPARRTPLRAGHSYRVTFTEADSGRVRYDTEITVTTASGQTPAAYRAWIMRWTKFGANTATIEELG